MQKNNQGERKHNHSEVEKGCKLKKTFSCVLAREREREREREMNEEKKEKEVLLKVLNEREKNKGN